MTSPNIFNITDDQIGGGNTGGTSSTPVITPTPTATSQNEVICPPIGAFMGCSGTANIGIFSLGIQPDGGCLTEERQTSRCGSPPPPPTCNYTDQTVACSTLPGLANTIGTATRTVLVTNSSGVPLPVGCVETPNIATDWDTSECISVTTTCPEPNIFLKCIGSLGTYTGLTPSNYSGPCLTYQVIDDPRCIPVPPRRWRLCDSDTITDGSPPNDVTLSADNIGVCYRTPINSTWRLCGSPTSTDGSPPSNYIQDSDNLGICYAEERVRPPVWRLCGDNTQIVEVRPPNLIQSNDNTGICYREPEVTVTDTWRECDTNVTRAGFPTSEYVASTDENGVCYTLTRTQPVDPTWRICGEGQARSGSPFNGYTQDIDDIGVCYRVIIVPPPRQWRDCIDGQLKDEPIPDGYVQSTFNGESGNICWEPVSVVGFSPSLAESLTFTHQRGTSNFPQPKTITATNSSYVRTMQVKITTNPDIIVRPDVFSILPRNSAEFTVNVTPQLIEKLGDGTSTIQMSINISEV